jgi:Big-like domain-containing protein/PKD domain-containing protein
MVTRRQAALFITALAFASVAACDKVPLLAPTGSVITLIPATNTVSLNSQIQIIATVIENGQAPAGTGSGSGTTTTSRTGAGTPVQNGTVVTFTTTIGTIQPQEARTHDGQVTVTLITGSQSGTAVITAYSGGASAQAKLDVGTAAVKTVTVSATPQSLSAAGGNSQVTAQVTDAGGSPLSGIPVTFSTDKGTVSPATATTDANGNATATLNTTATAKVTATVGSVNSSVTVNVNSRSLSSFIASPSSAAAGTPLTFTVTPASGSNVNSVHIDFGDGSSTDLGAVTSASTVPHVYSSPGVYTATATARDATGDSGSLSTQVVIGALQITLSASPNPTSVDVPTTFTVGALGSAQIDHFTWNFDDGQTATTTSPQYSRTFSSRGTKTVRVDVFGVTGGKIASQTMQITVQ